MSRPDAQSYFSSLPPAPYFGSLLILCPCFTRVRVFELLFRISQVIRF
jgi:hypothetical protein